MKQVFVYTRVSTAEQLDGSGHNRQLEECHRFCDVHDWQVLRSFEEQSSGSVSAMDRPVLSELISLCGDAYDVKTIVIERADRIARDLIVSELFFQECKSRGIEVYAADCGEELVNADSDPTRRLIRQVLGALSEWSKNEIAKKLLAGRKRTKELTGFPCGGKPIYGRKPGEDIWVWRMLYYHRKGIGLTKLCRKLNYNQAWMPTRPKFWRNSTVAGIIKFWENRAEFSEERMRQVCNGPEGSKIFPAGSFGDLTY
jgi:DNA invertase Pin-like site-specific DNA recombinase